ncbi:MAG: CTP synthase [Actinomycetia bacterium]|nr:CTP synthase [Actinomycetes bacterium]
MAKYIFITGGVVSSVGKGIMAASLGRLLKSNNLKVIIQKLDPYLNIDPGTMSPFQHGEVFVTEDGAETDLDLGHYERFTGVPGRQSDNVTSGRIYWSVVNKERKGKFLGGTVQVIPHITNEIKERIIALPKNNNVDIVIVEVGGTVGDIEGLPFLEAIRQLKKDLGENNTFYIHVTLIPYLKASAELKTKPTQHSVKELRSIGIQPDAIVCRSERPLDKDIRKKVALFCDVDLDAVIDSIDVDSIYEVPVMLNREKLDKKILEKLNIKNKKTDLREWKELIEKVKNLKKKVKIAIVGKYVKLPDAYLSIVEALRHGGIYNDLDVEIQWVDADKLSLKKLHKKLDLSDGILIPGGFGLRGIEGKIKAVKFARENKKPLLGICLGLQCAVIEFARNVCGMKKANSTEFNSTTPYPVIDLMPEQKKIKDKGGTMRLGSYPCKIKERTKARKAYRKEKINERHRHRFEVNNKYRKNLEKHGMIFSGLSPNKKLVEMIELKDHPFFICCQFHPEFKSRPNKAHPLFIAFIKASS